MLKAFCNVVMVIFLTLLVPIKSPVALIVLGITVFEVLLNPCVATSIDLAFLALSRNFTVYNYRYIYGLYFPFSVFLIF